ncbi:hypothetical protein Tdes44962_MAKER05799 [Teratosphaeria destructans]|uniref:Uncharacterized protein n=1 Tax=Teratosphaeria destructans TaxID=418781 RepID=A0A9W7VYM1_9PEZI|nr:hypothetical protein Tdes44962_MAKER05799 [Teratosphaeria destructans]
MPDHFRCDSPMFNGRPARRLHSIDDYSAESSSEQGTVVDQVEVEADQEMLEQEEEEGDVGQAVVAASPNPVYVAGSIGANSPVILSPGSRLGFHGTDEREVEYGDDDGQSEERQAVQESRDSVSAQAEISDTTTEGSGNPSPSSVNRDQGTTAPPRQNPRPRRPRRLPSSRLDTEQIEWAKRVRARLARYSRETANRGGRLAGYDGRRRVAGRRWVEEDISPIEMVLGRRRQAGSPVSSEPVSESVRLGGRDDARRASRRRGRNGWVWTAEQAYREEWRVAAISAAADRAIEASERLLAGGVAGMVC